MTGIQRMIKSGIRLYNCNQRGINFAASPINRLGESAGPYRSLCSTTCGDDSLGVSNVKHTFNVDTSAMTSHLKGDGIPPHKAEAITKSMVEYLVELETVTAAGVDSSIELKEKFKSLEKSMKFDKMKEQPEAKKWKYIAEGGSRIALIAALTYYFTSK